MDSVSIFHRKYLDVFISIYLFIYLLFFPFRFLQFPIHQAIRRGESVPIEVDSEEDIERKSIAREFIMDFLQAANFRCLERIRENPHFADAWASVFSGDAAMALKYKGEGRPKLGVPITAIEGSLDAVSRVSGNGTNGIHE